MSQPVVRLLTPDVARGFMLLFIAIANITTMWALFGSGSLMMTGIPVKTPADVVVNLFNSTFVHQRALPMFATLFGYGIGTLTMHYYRVGIPLKQAKQKLYKRYLWLGIFGIIHAIFIFSGDILLPYALIAGSLILLMLQSTDRTIKKFFWIMYSLMIAVTVVVLSFELLLRAVAPATLIEIQNYLSSDDAGLGWIKTYPGYMAFGAMTALRNIFGGFIALFLMIGPVAALGFIAGRAEVLHRVSEHKSWLRRLCMWGFAISISGGLLSGILSLNLFSDTPWFITPLAISYITGIPGGLAAIALVALLTQRFENNKTTSGIQLPLLITMLQALGKRSLSGYLFQSLAFILLLPPFTLNLMPQLGAAAATLLAAMVWTISLVAAWLLERAGISGPAEKLHRRLSDTAQA